MEVSSHALDLFRVHACDVDVAVFTNLTQDHLDFHLTWRLTGPASASCSSRSCRPRRENPVRAVINMPMIPKALSWPAALTLPHWTTSQAKKADVQRRGSPFRLHGITAQLQTPRGALVRCVRRWWAVTIWKTSSMPWARCRPGVDALEAMRPASPLENVPGRLERVADPTGRRFVYVDYAHTPDALENTLQALRASPRSA
jgi:UDP-N-acetylmuramyl tripeptide synthase